MNGSVAASNRAAAASFSFGAEKAIDNYRNRGLGLTQHFIFICFELGNLSARNFVEYREARETTSRGQ